MSRTHAAVATCMAAVLGSTLLLAQYKTTKPQPITIDIAGMKDGVTSIQTAGAWPLNVRLVANSPLGVATYKVPNQFPIDPQQGFIVFADPDGCFSLALANFGICPTDETYLEFTPTINLPNLGQYLLEKVVPRALGPRPTLHGWNGLDGGDSANSSVAEVGPYVGDAVSDCPAADGSYPRGCDNYGYGASPNIPGLVILSNRGVGLVWDENFTLASPLAARNLAGFANSVAWTLNDCIGQGTLPDSCENGRASVTAHMNVPVSLFTPVVRIDFGHSNSVPPYSDRWYQIDGASWVNDPSFALRSVLNEMVTTVRIFVVSGKAPDMLIDLDGDGVVTSKDARLAGYELLSGDKMVRFTTYHQEEEAAIGIMYDYKTSGSDRGMDHPVLPAGSGGITSIPR